MMLSEVERRLGLVDRPAAVVCDPRDQQVRHGLADALPAFIACGYEDPDDIDVLRTGPAFQVACGQVASAAQH